jgi:DNA polymerase elongation subunit (family B)
MIVDIEQLPDRFRISYFDKEGEIAFKEVSIPKSEKFKWELALGERKDGIYKTWDGKPVKKVQSFWLGRYRTEEFLTGLGDMLSDIYEFNLPNSWYCDIETEVIDDFPDPEIAQTRVLSVALVNSKAETIVLGLQELSYEAIDRIKNRYWEHVKDHRKGDSNVPFQYIAFKSESEMLQTLFSVYFRKAPLITGWNFVNYDWKYLINRCKRLGVDYTTCSPSKKTKGEECFPVHKVVVDYLDLYKKWDTTVKVKENFKLDTVGKATLGISKVKYNGSLTDLYNADYETFIFYNVIDTFLVYLIDRKIKTMQTFLSLGNATRIEAMRAFSPIHMTESILVREFLKRKMVVAESRSNNSKNSSFEGAYVKDPIPGLYEALATFDFASLYPTTMRQWNISPETFKGKIDLPEGKPWVKTASGAVFDNSYDSVMRTVLTCFFEERKRAKNTAKDLEKIIEVLKEKKAAAK